jgi:hypothetical protein
MDNLKISLNENDMTWKYLYRLPDEFDLPKWAKKLYPLNTALDTIPY